MSSNSSLSSAKRRRVGLPNPVGVPNQSQGKSQFQPPQSQSRQFQQQKQSSQEQSQKSVIQESSKEFDSEYTSTSSNSGFPLLPPPPVGVSLNQILSTHHLYINKMANDFSVAIDELGNTFNMLSSNCDNLNERLTSFEETGSPSNVSVSSQNVELNLLNNNDFVSLRNDVKTLNDRLNVFDSDLKELKELKVLLLKNQGLILDNTLNITNIKSEYNKKMEELSAIVNRLSNKVNEYNSVLTNVSCNVDSSVDEYISSSLSETLNKTLLRDVNDIDENSTENISLSVYEN
jgi:hypothetical protein